MQGLGPQNDASFEGSGSLGQYNLQQKTLCCKTFGKQTNNSQQQLRNPWKSVGFRARNSCNHWTRFLGHASGARRERRKSLGTRFGGIIKWQERSGKEFLLISQRGNGKFGKPSTQVCAGFKETGYEQLVKIVLTTPIAKVVWIVSQVPFDEKLWKIHI